LSFKNNKIRCAGCGFEVVIDTTDKEYQKLYLIYKELYEYKKNKGDLEKKKKERLASIKYCSICGSIFREYMCESKHICTAFKFCPICGKEASLSC